ncbi:MAG: hypothetical protein M1834_000492 [Cirrosporium novae-zelandiae]|nr:MAG: hypothetical protein M1834_000492 [Cirrosporium novae-zelandiae]
MKISEIIASSLVAGAAQAFNCTPSAFTAALPSNATVAFAYTVAENATFNVVGDVPYPTDPTELPELCALQVNIPTTNESDYNFGVFLPKSWNGRFLAVGNGGFGGGINWLDMGAGVHYGFAVVSTDTGHNSSMSDATWAYKNTEKVTDWGWRALHGSIVNAKAVTEAYYSETPSYSYYTGCSTGGRQGMKEAQMFPEDFNGIMAGAPAWWTTHLQLFNLKAQTYNAPSTGSNNIPTDMFSTIADEVVKQCDPQDGVNDTIIMNPKQCDFNIEAFLCSGNSTDNYLTNDQLDTLYYIYNDWVDTNQTFVFPHYEIGSESQWSMGIGDGEISSTEEYVQYMLDQGTDWSWEDLDYSTVLLSDSINPGNATADHFDISAFKANGGKLLHYHGYSDGSIPTGSSIYYYNQVFRELVPQGIDLDSFYRFFLVSGMEHCTSTPSNMAAPWYFAGGNQASAISTSVYGVPGYRDSKHDALLALMAWVENGTAPDEIIATKWYNDTPANGVYRQRPLCVFPKQAKYKGSGDTNAAENWECTSLY